MMQRTALNTRGSMKRRLQKEKEEKGRKGRKHCSFAAA